MSAKLFLTPLQILPQPDFEASEDENGNWKGTQTFWIEKGGYDNLSVRLYFERGKTPIELDENNDSFFDFLSLKTASVATEIGGYSVIKVDYQGYVPPLGGPGNNNDKPYMTTSYRGTLKSVPINQHPKFTGLTGQESFMMRLLLEGDFVLNIDGQTIGQWVPFTDETAAAGEQETMKYYPLENTEAPESPYEFASLDAQELAQLISKGTREYDVGTYEYVVRWSQDEPITAEDIDELGLITTPIGDPVVPTDSGRNWRLITINQEQEGTVNPTYTMEVVYLLSDRGGWDTTLYTPEV